MKLATNARSCFFIMPSIIFVFVSFVLFSITPSSVEAQGETRIVDKLHIMGTDTDPSSYFNEAKAIITTLEQNDKVLIGVYLDDQTFADKDSFNKSANSTYTIYNLNVLENPVYNVLLYYAKVGNKMHLAYVHSSKCKPFQDFLNDMTSGDLDEVLTGQNVSNIVKTLSYRIKEIKDAYGADCYSAEGEKTQETEIEARKVAYLIDDTNWKDVLSLIPLTTRHFLPPSLEGLSPDKKIREMKNYVIFSPTLVYHREDEAFDLYSTINFLKDFEPNEVIIVYNDAYTEKLKEKLKLALKDHQTEYITSKDYSSIWNKRNYESVVISEDNYATGLVASLFASYINAPLVFSSSDLASYTKYKTVYCVGDVKYKCTQKNTTEELQRYYQQITGTEKLILVNPNDIKDENCEQIAYTTEFGRMEKSHCKDSLLSPLLATMKNELIVPIESEPLKNGMLKLVPPKEFKEFFVDKDENFYFQMPFSVEKYNFDKLDKKTIYKATKKIKFSTMSTNGNIYLVVENGDVFEIKNDNPVKIFSIDKSEIKDALDFNADEAGNTYFIYSCHLSETCDKTYIKKFNSNGNLLYESKIAEDVKLEDYVKKLSHNVNHNDIDFYVYQRRLFVRSDGIYILFLMYPEENKGDYDLILYKFDEEKQNENWLEDKNTHKVYYGPDVMAGMYMDDEENIYLAQYTKGPDNSILFFHFGVIFDWKRKYGEINFLSRGDFYKYFYVPYSTEIFSYKEKVYIIFNVDYNNNVIVVFDKNRFPDLIGGVGEKDIIRIINGLPECYFYSEVTGSNPEKSDFETDINEKEKTIKEKLNKEVQTTEGSYKYLTVVASPRAIPFSHYGFCKPEDKTEIRLPLDREYVDGVVSGRIYGITISDTSSYINRVLASSKGGETFVLSDGEMKKFEKIGMAADGFPFEQNYLSPFKKTLAYNDYDVVCTVGNKGISKDCDHNTIKKANIKYFTGKDIIVYDDHGLVNSLDYVHLTSSYISNMPEMVSTIAITDACLTGDYYASYVDVKMPNLLASNFLRKGGLGYFGAVSVSVVAPIAQILTSEIMSGSDLGNALKSTVERVVAPVGVVNYFSMKRIDPNYALFGDPTIKPALKKEVELGYVEPLKQGGNDGYECTLAGGGADCYRKGFFKMYCGEDYIVKGLEKLKCEELPSKSGKISRDTSQGLMGSKWLPRVVVFSGRDGTVTFKEMGRDDPVSIECGDFNYEGPALMTGDWEAWLGEGTCETTENEWIGDKRLVYLDESKDNFVKVPVT